MDARSISATLPLNPKHKKFKNLLEQNQANWICREAPFDNQANCKGTLVATMDEVGQ